MGERAGNRATLARVTFGIGRETEYFSEKELTRQIGHGKAWWPIALLKELLGNALDAGEAASAAPMAGPFHQWNSRRWVMSCTAGSLPWTLYGCQGAQQTWQARRPVVPRLYVPRPKRERLPRCRTFLSGPAGTP